MKFPVSLVLNFLMGIILTEQAVPKINEITKKCRAANCEDGPYCFGMNTLNAGGEEKDGNSYDVGKDDCNRGMSPVECSYSFAAVTKLASDKFKVQLMGKIGPGEGWVGAAFRPAKTGRPEEIENIANGPGFALVCLTDATPNVQTIELGTYKVMTTNKASKSEFGRDPDHAGWILCDFELEHKPDSAYYVGFLLNTQNGAVTFGRIAKEEEPATTSAKFALDFLTLLQAGKATSTFASGSLLVIMLMAKILL